MDDTTPHPGPSDATGLASDPPAPPLVELPAWPPRVLLVEPDQDRRIRLVRWLRKAGWVVLPVLETEQALRLLRLGGTQGRPDLVVVEKGQGGGGFDSMVRNLREIPSLAGVAVLTYEGANARAVSDLIQRLDIWLECLKRARQEYSAGRRSSPSLI